LPVRLPWQKTRQGINRFVFFAEFVALIVRLDIDRPYGKRPVHRHILSRLGSDLYCPKIRALGYLKELEEMLRRLNEKRAQAHVYFRRCTLPSANVMELLEQGGHEIGLHLEDSRSFASFAREKGMLERHIGRRVRTFSKHGSGGARYGYHHFAPYEPQRYLEWARETGIRLFLGNLEDPTMPPERGLDGVLNFPSAFWLEPHWRDTTAFTIDWLMTHARNRDIVLLVHPENVLESPELSGAFDRLIGGLETKIFS
jgi:peptidoglycan/xylan/chitin deacetylase (PgdA/CDA1 family)